MLFDILVDPFIHPCAFFIIFGPKFKLIGINDSLSLDMKGAEVKSNSSLFFFCHKKHFSSFAL
jgi:hypothetical protein